MFVQKMTEVVVLFTFKLDLNLNFEDKKPREKSWGTALDIPKNFYLFSDLKNKEGLQIKLQVNFINGN